MPGADKFVYAPEPIDVGRLLEADIVSNGQKVSLTTTAPIDPGWSLSPFMSFHLTVHSKGSSVIKKFPIFSDSSAPGYSFYIFIINVDEENEEFY